MELTKLETILEESSNIRQMVIDGSSDSEIVAKQNLEQLKQDSIKPKALRLREDFFVPNIV